MLKTSDLTISLLAIGKLIDVTPYGSKQYYELVQAERNIVKSLLLAPTTDDLKDIKRTLERK